ncbi:MAG: transporter substrate-binding domain-containing protein [Paracoccaceae bacterium]
MIQKARLIASVFAGVLALSSAALARCEDYVPQDRPQNVGRDEVGLDLDGIVERGWIDIILYEDFAPYSYVLNGKPTGVDVEIGRLIAQELGVEPRFRFVSASEELEADLFNWIWKGPIVGGAVGNLMMRVPYNSEYACRVEQVVFTGQYASESIAIAYSEAAYPDEKPIPAYFRFDTVGVENDSISDFYLTSFPGGQLSKNISRYPTTLDAMKGLAAGEVMAVMGPRSQLDAGLTEGIAAHAPPLPGFSVGKWTLGVAVNFRYRPLGYAIDDAIFAGLEDGRISDIYGSFGLTFQPPER